VIRLGWHQGIAHSSRPTWVPGTDPGALDPTGTRAVEIGASLGTFCASAYQQYQSTREGAQALWSNMTGGSNAGRAP
jgi:hypothetical protein